MTRKSKPYFLEPRFPLLSTALADSPQMPAGTDGPIVPVSVDSDALIGKLGPSAPDPSCTVAELTPDPRSTNGIVTDVVSSTRLTCGLNEIRPRSGGVKSTFTVAEVEATLPHRS